MPGTTTSRTSTRSSNGRVREKDSSTTCSGSSPAKIYGKEQWEGLFGVSLGTKGTSLGFLGYLLREIIACNRRSYLTKPPSGSSRNKRGV